MNKTTPDDPAASLPVTRAGIEGAIGSVPAAGGSPAPETTDLPHLMKSLSYVPTDDRVPQALRDGAEAIERLRETIANQAQIIAGLVSE